MDEYYAARDHISSHLPHSISTPTVGIVCGSGLGKLHEVLINPISMNYKDIPGFVQSTVPGHAGKLVFGQLGQQQVLCMVGRFHAYEGYTMHQITFPIRVMALLGIKFLIVTNAAGTLNPTFNIGDIMCICDHAAISMMAGKSPLIGQNLDEFGPRFVACSNIYSRPLRQHAFQTAKALGLFPKIHEGVYGYAMGPQYETRAECRLLRQVCDVVGMSTVPEALVAHHAGIHVLGFTLVTNKAIGQPEMSVKEQVQMGDTKPDGAICTEVHASHSEVLASSKEFANDVQNLVREIIVNLHCVDGF